jgi:hypothetical protein
MENDEAGALLAAHLESYRHRTYRDVVALVGKTVVEQVRGASGAAYQVEVEVRWDGQPGTAVRVLGAIDDGGTRAFRPQCDDFIVAADGRLSEDE